MRIAITGICGTWGQAFTELLKNDNEILGFDNNEKSVSEFRHIFPNIDVRLSNYGDWCYQTDPVDLIIHLAAFKHIGICEENVMSCVKNNIIETYKLFNEAKFNGVKVLFISTDKAVEPVSTYGMTKSLGERMCWDCGGQVSRSSNITISNGSVFGIWDKLIKEKKNIKISDPNILRYFVDVKDAVKETWKGFLEDKKLIIIKGKEKKLSDFLGDILISNGYDFDYTKYPYGVEITGKQAIEKIKEKLIWDNESCE